MGSPVQTSSMLALHWVILTLGAVRACNDIEDPVKRDEDAPGPWEISRVEWNSAGRKGKLVPVVLGDSHPLGRTALYEGDSYVINYSFRKGRKPDLIYYWQGSKSSTFEKGASAILTVELDNNNGGVAKQVRVEMGKEPGHFLNMMGGTLVTLMGGVVKGGKTVQDTDGVMLFRVTSQCNAVGTKKPLVRTRQVEETRDSLSDQDAFILDTQRGLFIWAPTGSSAEERKTAETVAKTLFPKKTAKVFTDSQIPADFTSILRN